MSDADDLIDDSLDDDLAEHANPEVRSVIASFLRSQFLTVESDPDLFRLAVHHKDEVRAWFAAMLGWPFEVYPADGLCRLYKRRWDPPANRPPRINLPGVSRGRSASPLVITLMCLVCEQLWRHPETSFNDLQRALVQTCATESESGRLPRFQPVTQAGEGRARANAHRLALVDALRLLEDWHVIAVDQPLDVAEQDQRADLIVTARRERLAALPATSSPSLMDIDLDRPDTHVPALCGDQAELPEHASARQQDLRRRHTALRVVLDDPGVAPQAGSEAGRYLASTGGQRQAVDAAAAAGLVCCVRRDWWIVSDPDGTTTDVTFPLARNIEEQAALVLLQALGSADSTPPVFELSLTEAAAHIQEHLDEYPRWAASQRSRGPQHIAKKAVRRLVEAGVLVKADHSGTRWTVTPAAQMWQVRVTDLTQAPALTPDAKSDLAEGHSDD
ncbi:DUF2398 family protein [Streptomyces sp. NPDC056149]|uniref:DUF2398 family protein n=1 Tax=Streptomyces sp. NPDC056149 TaxID=3345728 RepID=UPI0035E2B8A3